MGRKRGVSQGSKLSAYMKKPARPKRKPTAWNEFTIHSEWDDAKRCAGATNGPLDVRYVR